MNRFVVKKFLCFILAAVMLLSAFPVLTLAGSKADIILNNGKKLSECQKGDIVAFGYYPQSKLTDETVLAGLKKQSDYPSSTSRMTSFRYYTGNSTYSGNMKPADFMYYADRTYNGTRYRAIYFTYYRPFGTVNGITNEHPTNYNQYQYGYYTNTLYWFIYEPILWYVVDPQNGVLMCCSAIDSQPFHSFVSLAYKNSVGTFYGDKENTVLANDYSISQLRSWLLNDFYNTAFSAEEKAWIYSSSQYDAVSLLSEQEYLDYGLDCSDYDALITDYSKVHGVSGTNKKAYSIWLCDAQTEADSSGRYGGIARIWVYSGSDTGYFGNRSVYSNSVGVRPRIRIKSTDYNIATCCGHDYNKKVTPNTCETGGDTVFTCKICGYCYQGAFTDAMGHDMKVVNAVAATCVEKGVFQYYACSRCDHISWDPEGKQLMMIESTISPINPTNHKSTLKKTSAVAATCINTGIVEHYYCASCKNYYFDAAGTQKMTDYANEKIVPINPVKHPNTLQHTNYKAPTCSATGNIEYWYCSSCKNYYTDSAGTQKITKEETVIAVNPVNHPYTLQHISYKAPACVNTGNIEYWYCSYCKNYYTDSAGTQKITKEETVIADLGGHDWRTVAYKAPTCTVSGWNEYQVCKRSGCSATQCAAGVIQLPATGHSYKYCPVTPSTCTVPGMAEHFECYNCTAVFTPLKIEVSRQELTAALGNHTLVPHEGTPATYFDAGCKSYYTCQYCTYTTYEVIPPLKDTVTLNTDSIKSKSNGFIYVLSGTTVAELLSLLGGENAVTDAKNTVMTMSSYIGSGAKLLLKQNGEAIGAISLVVPGDVDGDGKVTSSDARLALRKSVGLESFDEKSGAFRGADMDFNNAVQASDARFILRLSVGLEKASLE